MVVSLNPKPQYRPLNTIIGIRKKLPLILGSPSTVSYGHPRGGRQRIGNSGGPKDHTDMSYSLSSLRGGYVGDHIGEYYRTTKGILGG